MHVPENLCGFNAKRIFELNLVEKLWCSNLTDREFTSWFADVTLLTLLILSVVTIQTSPAFWS